MKKLFTLLLAVVYLGSSVGATLHVHYCMDKLVNWTLNDEGDKCKNCGMEKDGGCCRDENKLIKSSSDQSITGAIQIFSGSTADPSIPFINKNEYCLPSFVSEYPANYIPPIRSGTDILIRNCMFRV